MKIAIAGKGGVGKTTLAALIALRWEQQGYEVLAVDADPDPHLAATLGMDGHDKVRPICEMSELVQERTGARPGMVGQMFTLNPRVDDISEKYSLSGGRIKVIVMGGVKAAGGGCACPENALLRALMQHLLLQEKERVVMDMPAGIEHLGRATARAVSALVVVIEPGLRSIRTASKIARMAGELGIGKVVAVANKIRGEKDRLLLANALSGLPVVAFLPFIERLMFADQGEVLRLEDSFLRAEIDRVLDALE
jgi:CO dehydrogenase maturation factor